MVQHVKVEHYVHDNSVPMACTATLVVTKSSGNGYVECPVLVKRTSTLDCVPSSLMKGSSVAAAGTSTRTKTSKRRVSSSSSEDDDSDDDDLSLIHI